MNATVLASVARGLLYRVQRDDGVKGFMCAGCGRFFEREMAARGHLGRCEEIRKQREKPILIQGLALPEAPEVSAIPAAVGAPAAAAAAAAREQEQTSIATCLFWVALVVVGGWLLGLWISERYRTVREVVRCGYEPPKEAWGGNVGLSGVLTKVLETGAKRLIERLLGGGG